MKDHLARCMRGSRRIVAFSESWFGDPQLYNWSWRNGGRDPDEMIPAIAMTAMVHTPSTLFQVHLLLRTMKHFQTWPLIPPHTAVDTWTCPPRV